MSGWFITRNPHLKKKNLNLTKKQGKRLLFLWYSLYGFRLLGCGFEAWSLQYSLSLFMRFSSGCCHREPDLAHISLRHAGPWCMLFSILLLQVCLGCPFSFGSTNQPEPVTSSFLNPLHLIKTLIISSCVLVEWKTSCWAGCRSLVIWKNMLLLFTYLDYRIEISLYHDIKETFFCIQENIIASIGILCMTIKHEKEPYSKYPVV